MFFALWFGVPFLDTDFNKQTFSFPTSPYHRDKHPNEEDTFSNSIPCPPPCRALQNREVATLFSYPPATTQGRGACEGLRTLGILVREDPRGAWGCWPQTPSSCVTWGVTGFRPSASSVPREAVAEGRAPAPGGSSVPPSRERGWPGWSLLGPERNPLTL